MTTYNSTSTSWEERYNYYCIIIITRITISTGTTTSEVNNFIINTNNKIISYLTT